MSEVSLPAGRRRRFTKNAGGPALLSWCLLAAALAAPSSGCHPSEHPDPGQPGRAGTDSAAIHAGPSWWRPEPGGGWQIQYSGLIDTSLPVPVYDLDLFETSPELIAQLHSEGKRVICYFGAGNFEPGRPDADRFPEEVLGEGIEGWPGERWIDIRQIAILEPLMTTRIDIAQRKGCDAVDPDCVDGYAQQTGFSIEPSAQLAYNRMIARTAHSRGLAVSLKNDLDQVDALVASFDMSVNEQCFEFEECEKLLPFLQHGKPVFQIEYQGDQQRICARANHLGFDTVFKRLHLDAFRIPCR